VWMWSGVVAATGQIHRVGLVIANLGCCEISMHSRPFVTMRQFSMQQQQQPGTHHASVLRGQQEDHLQACVQSKLQARVSMQPECEEWESSASEMPTMFGLVHVLLWPCDKPLGWHTPLLTNLHADSYCSTTAVHVISYLSSLHRPTCPALLELRGGGKMLGTGVHLHHTTCPCWSQPVRPHQVDGPLPKLVHLNQTHAGAA
jgi:hypothetical protein